MEDRGEQTQEDDGTWKLMLHGIMGGMGVMLLIQILIGFAGSQ